MSQKEEWLSQYVALLRGQVKDLSALSLECTEHYYALKKKHQQEKAKLPYLRNEPIQWTQLLTKHSGQITELMNSQMLRRTLLLAKHKQQEEALHERIIHERIKLENPRLDVTTPKDE